jgi:hypothetical protein
MRNGKRYSHQGVGAMAFITCCATLVVLLAGCGSSKPKASSTNVASGAAGKPATAGGVNLSGNWNGTYGGDFKGTFKLTWTQSGSALSGTITLSSPASTLNISGTINGNKIKFGTVGSAAISYTGSEQQGSVMEGNYTVGGPGGGNWGASKAS